MIERSERAPVATCLLTRCPHCLEATEFQLVRDRGSSLARLLCLGFSPPLWLIAMMPRKPEYLLACSRCGYGKHLNRGERMLLMDIAEGYSALLAGKLSAAAFDDLVATSALEPIAEIHEEANMWHCPECEAEIPPSMDTCWQCQYTDPDRVAQGQKQGKPNIHVGGGDPWLTM